VRNGSLLVSATFLGTAAALLAFAAFVPVARGDAGPQGTIGVSEVHEGMKGYGLTVFKGTDPERFDVEVIGVLHNFRPGQDLILIKTPHPRLDIVKTVAGMSGSPIYLDGRLAGAYAYSLGSFEVEPVAGVTPIAPMLTELARPTPPGFWFSPRRSSGIAPASTALGVQEPRHADRSGTTTFDGPPGSYDLGVHASQIAARIGDPSGSPYVRASTPLLLAGVGDRTTAMLRTLFGGLDPLQTGGGQGPIAGAPQHFVDGGGLGVELVRGDVSMMGLGTVTHVQGTKLVGFGHPMMNGGDSALPTSIGRVLWINASAQRSFKVGESARSLGTLVQDRQSAVVIDESLRAPTFPISVDVVGANGAPRKAWHMEVADERFMAPTLAAGALGSVIEATVAEQRDVTWQMKSTLTIRGHGALDLEDFGIAVGGMPEQGEMGRSRLVRAIGDIMNNPWEEVTIDKVQATLTVTYAREVWHLRGVELTSDEIDAGHSAHVRVHLVPFEGKEVVREVEVPIPASFAGTDVEIEVAPGFDVTSDQAAPDNLPELLANETHQSYLPKSLVLQIKAPAQSVVFQGSVARELPSFAFDALRPVHSDIGGDAVATYLRTVVPVDHYVDGRDKVKVKVRRVMR
jgi:hypothetical protein